MIPNAETVGFRAAEMLTQLMDGDTPAEQSQLIRPLGVATRQSTDVVAIEDRRWRADGGFAFIDQHLHGTPSASLIGRAFEDHVLIAQIMNGFLAAVSEGQQRPFFRDDKGRGPVRVIAVLAGLENRQ